MLVALAVLVKDAAGAVVAAMNVCSYSPRTGPAALLADCLSLLRRTACEIESKMQVADRGGPLALRLSDGATRWHGAGSAAARYRKSPWA